MKALLISKKISKESSRLMIKAGAKGKGRELWACNYWHNSPMAVDQAYMFMEQWCEVNPGWNVQIQEDW